MSKERHPYLINIEVELAAFEVAWILNHCSEDGSGLSLFRGFLTYRGSFFPVTTSGESSLRMKDIEVSGLVLGSVFSFFFSLMMKLLIL